VRRWKILAGRAIKKFTGDWAFLSNFYAWEADWNGIIFPTSEHAFQAAKCTNSQDMTKIYKAKTPKKAKFFGRSVGIRADWDTFRVHAMKEILTSKFTMNKEHGIYLLSTSGANLVEGNYWHDNFWGDCYCGRLACESPGKNFLGRLLMGIREEIWYSKSS
jgi:ribA/ribD-fused uncharacterized protein